MDGIEFVRGTDQDREAIADLGNYAFSHDYSATDFPSLLPKLYGPEAHTEQYHYLAKRDGKIIAMIGAFPFDAVIMGRKFRACGIGTVSVHPYCRGMGLMQSLLKNALDDMEKDGTAFTVLGGQRQRYEYFGYEPCGVLIDFWISQKNIHHFFRGRKFAEISFAPLERDDRESVRRCFALYERQLFRVVRDPAQFHTVCRSWGAAPYLIMKDGRFCGYLVCSGDKKSILELEMDDLSLLPDVLAAYFSGFGAETVNYSLPPFEKEKIRILEAFSEAHTVDTAHSFRIFDYKNIIRQLLLLKATYARLADGRLILKIGENAALAVEVRGKEITVEETGEQADLTLEPLKAMRFLFSPMSAFFDYAPGCSNPAISWFPLPFSLQRADEV